MTGTTVTNQMRFSEPEIGWEAYISGKEPRTQRILDQITERFNDEDRDDG